MEFHVITLFPEMFDALEAGLIGRAARQGLITSRSHDLRAHGLGNYRQVDDTPYGGGSGMVMRPEPIAAAIDSARAERAGLLPILMTPQGEVLDQAMVREFAQYRPGLLLIAGVIRSASCELLATNADEGGCATSAASSTSPASRCL